MCDDFLEVHVDETGDRGFGENASPYFCLAACVYRHSKARVVIEALHKLNRALERDATEHIHSRVHLRSHGRMMEACERLGALDDTVRILFVVMPKNSTPQDAAMRGDSGTAYRYPVRLLLERVSWLARDIGTPAQVTLAHIRRMRREPLDDYVSLLQSMSTQIDWKRLRLPLKIEPAEQRVGLQWADIAARALSKAMIPSPKVPYRTEAAYLNALALVIWRKRSIETYGIKSIAPDWYREQPWWQDLVSRIPLSAT